MSRGSQICLKIYRDISKRITTGKTEKVNSLLVSAIKICGVESFVFVVVVVVFLSITPKNKEKQQ